MLGYFRGEIFVFDAGDVDRVARPGAPLRLPPIAVPTFKVHAGGSVLQLERAH